MRVTLLGLQRRAAGVRAAVAEILPDGPVAAVNAGWREREGETGELDEVLGGRLSTWSCTAAGSRSWRPTRRWRRPSSG